MNNGCLHSLATGEQGQDRSLHPIATVLTPLGFCFGGNDSPKSSSAKQILLLTNLYFLPAEKNKTKQ